MVTKTVIPMIFFNAHPIHTFNHWRGGIFLNNKFSRSLEVCRLGFMEEVDMKTANDLDEQTVDVL